MPALQTTVKIVGAALSGDSNVSAKQRARVLALLRNGEETKPEQAPQNLPLIVRRSVCAQLLGRSVRSVDMLVKEGLLQKKTFKGKKQAAGITRESLLRMLEEGTVSTPRKEGQ